MRAREIPTEQGAHMALVRLVDGWVRLGDTREGNLSAKDWSTARGLQHEGLLTARPVSRVHVGDRAVRIAWTEHGLRWRHDVVAAHNRLPYDAYPVEPPSCPPR